MAECKVCGASFEAPNNMTKICSDECRKKSNAKSRERWRKSTPETRAAWSRYSNNWRKNNVLRYRLNNIRNRAAKEGLPFDLVEADLAIPDKCPILGIEFNESDRESSWSIDRLIPELGYVRDNIAIISVRANRLKSDMTLDEIEKIHIWFKLKQREFNTLTDSGIDFGQRDEESA